MYAPGAAREAINEFDDWWRQIHGTTYIASISEHDDTEDKHGRLSMWRAFGTSGPRVALVLKVPVYSKGSLALNLHFSPIAYLPEEKVHESLFGVITNVKASSDFLRLVSRPTIVQYVFGML